jgi:uncharacterized protein (TIGR00369 family)
MVSTAVTADEINAVVRDLYPAAAATCVEVGVDYAVAAVDVDPNTVRPGGFVSGPTQFAIVDAALWYVTFAALGRVEPMAMTSELSMRFLRPAQGNRLYCRAELEAISRRSVVATAHVWCDDRTDKITATAQGTYAIPLR